MSRGRKDDASLKRLSVYASNIQSPWLWKSARFSSQVVVVAVQSPSCVQLFVTHELQHVRIQFAGLTVKMCGGQSMQSRGVVQGLGRRSLELLSTCLIKSPKCKFPPMTTHCISDFGDQELSSFFPSRGSYIFPWAATDNGKQRRTMAITFYYKGIEIDGLTVNHVKPLWHYISDSPLTLVCLLSHRNYLHEEEL